MVCVSRKRNRGLRKKERKGERGSSSGEERGWRMEDATIMGLAKERHQEKWLAKTELGESAGEGQRVAQSILNR